MIYYFSYVYNQAPLIKDVFKCPCMQHFFVYISTLEVSPLILELPFTSHFGSGPLRIFLPLTSSFWEFSPRFILPFVYNLIPLNETFLFSCKVMLPLKYCFSFFIIYIVYNSFFLFWKDIEGKMLLSLNRWIDVNLNTSFTSPSSHIIYFYSYPRTFPFQHYSCSTHSLNFSSY